MPRQSHARIQAAITGKAGKIGPQEAHTRNVLAITKRIHSLDRKIVHLKTQLANAQLERRIKKQELRAVLQRDHTMGIDDDARLEVAGRADAIDASEARREQK